MAAPLKKSKIKKSKIQPSNKVAVIDIGSNSVRLVIYDTDHAKPKAVEQMKATCRLAEGMTHKNQKLNAAGMIQTLKALQRFRKRLTQRKVTKVFAIATAAMRAVAESKQGEAFHGRAERVLGQAITIISGRTEARLMAYGVMNYLPSINGICADLGGGSLELASISGKRIHHTATLDLGALTLFSECKGHTLLAAYLARTQLAAIPFIGDTPSRNLYIVGGSWRAIARLLMKRIGMPVQKIHGFSIDGKLAQLHAIGIASKKPSAFRRMPKKISQRADVVPIASVVLAELIDAVKPRRIIFSGHGLREGAVQAGLNGTL